VRFSEEVTRQHGVTLLQYLLLLHIKGYPGCDWATVGELAERLQAQQHGVVALISRCEKLSFVERRRSSDDRRRVEIHLLKNGKKCSINSHVCTGQSCYPCVAVSLYRM
jgi:DNA-binding MarR family transcriptional regulator